MAVFAADFRDDAGLWRVKREAMSILDARRRQMLGQRSRASQVISA